MKLAIITLAAALSAAAVVPAQAQETQPRRPQARAERMDPTQRVERRVQMLTERLDLSAAQATRVKAIVTQEAEQMKAFFDKNHPARDGQRPTDEERTAFRTQMQQMNARTHAEIAKVLNADQLKKFDELRERRGMHDGMGPRREGRQPRGGAPQRG